MSYTEELFSVAGKVVVITGGNGMLGTQYATTLSKAGARVAVFDVAAELNEKLASLPDVKLYTVDITKKNDIKEALRRAESELGIPEILINNAALDSPPGNGAGGENESLENYSLESWNAVWNVNATGTFLMCQVVGGRMAQAGKGSIINISSTYGVVSPDQRAYEYKKEDGVPFVKPISYSATKSAILNLTRYLATYWAGKGVRVNTLVPGGVFNNQDERFLSEYEKRVPLGRMARPGEYNGAILFLASDASSYMTGATLIIDGGWTAW